MTERRELVSIGSVGPCDIEVVKDARMSLKANSSGAESGHMPLMSFSDSLPGRPLVLRIYLGSCQQRFQQAVCVTEVELAV